MRETNESYHIKIQQKKTIKINGEHSQLNLVYIDKKI